MVKAFSIATYPVCVINYLVVNDEDECSCDEAFAIANKTYQTRPDHDVTSEVREFYEPAMHSYEGNQLWQWLTDGDRIVLDFTPVALYNCLE